MSLQGKCYLSAGSLSGAPRQITLAYVCLTSGFDWRMIITIKYNQVQMRKQFSQKNIYLWLEEFPIDTYQPNPLWTNVCDIRLIPKFQSVGLSPSRKSVFFTNAMPPI